MHLYVVILAIVQGLAELLPVSSSAHVIIAAKLLGIDPAAPDTTLLIVMLHTGTMVAVIAYFWRRWRRDLFPSWTVFQAKAGRLAVATLCTVMVGVPLVVVIPRLALSLGLLGVDAAGHIRTAEVESLFGNLALMGASLAVVGVLILIAGLRERRSTAIVADVPGSASASAPMPARDLSWFEAEVIGAVQGLCLPFRGFSRSGATISTGILLGVAKNRAEEFSFALAVVVTPPVVVRELARALHAHPAGGVSRSHLAGDCLLGMVISFLAGLAALRWLSGWLEGGLWYLFGMYCLVAAGVVLGLHHAGF